MIDKTALSMTSSKEARHILAPHAEGRAVAILTGRCCYTIDKSAILYTSCRLLCPSGYPRNWEARVTVLAEQSDRSIHSLMVEAIERYVQRQEQARRFPQKAIAADADIENTGEEYDAEDVHDWIDQLAKGKKACQPKPHPSSRCLAAGSPDTLGEEVLVN